MKSRSPVTPVSRILMYSNKKEHAVVPRYNQETLFLLREVQMMQQRHVRCWRTEINKNIAKILLLKWNKLLTTSLLLGNLLTSGSNSVLIGSLTVNSLFALQRIVIFFICWTYLTISLSIFESKLV